MPTISPFKEALAQHRSRVPVGADLSSSQWGDVPLALRDRAFFTAGVENARYVQFIKERVESILDPRTVLRDGVPVTEGMDLATARAELKSILQATGYNPGDQAGGIQDLSSDGRLNLQLTHNVESAQGYGSFIQGQLPGALDAFPAQELFRAEERKEHRPWATRWMQAGGQIFGGRMIALKNDPIWEAISAFGTPFPPFDFNSGMWVRDIDRDEAVSLGLLGADEEVQPSVERFNAKLEASVKDISPELLESLQKTFGHQLVVEDGRARWSGR